MSSRGPTPLPDTRQLKESNSAREKTPPHTRGGIRANKTQNPPFSHTPKYTWMKNPSISHAHKSSYTHTHILSHTRGRQKEVHDQPLGYPILLMQVAAPVDQVDPMARPSRPCSRTFRSRRRCVVQTECSSRAVCAFCIPNHSTCNNLHTRTAGL